MAAPAVPDGEPTNPPPTARATWRTVAVPTEHGGWGLTLEPVLLGLLVGPSSAGAALGAAAFLAFLIRTPLKVALVDRRRDRWLPRDTAAARIAAGEAVLLAALAAATVRWSADLRWAAPLAAAAPLVATELWFDVRSRSRRLAPELAGAGGIASVAAAIVLAGGTSWALAGALWLVLAARSVASIPFVRAQVARVHGRPDDRRTSDLAQAMGLALATAAVLAEAGVVGGAAAVAALAAAQVVLARRPVWPVKAIGITQMLFGLVVVACTAASAR